MRQRQNKEEGISVVQMKLERIEQGSVTVMRLAGDLDDEGVKMLRLALLRCIKDRRCNVVVNLAQVGMVSYMALGVLVERLRQCRMCNGDLKLVGINLAMEQMFRQAGVSALFEVYESEANAVHVYQEAA